MKVLVLVLAVAVGGCTGQPREQAAPGAQSEDSGPQSWSADWVKRPSGLTAGCDGDACHGSSTALGQIPPEYTSVAIDVVVQATVEFKAAGATVGAGLSVVGDAAAAGVEMRPDSLPLYSAEPTTTTLRWVRRNVPASGGGYEVTIGIGGQGRIRGVVTNVSVTPSG
jgi:hypothetical protein